MSDNITTKTDDINTEIESSNDFGVMATDDKVADDESTVTVNPDPDDTDSVLDVVSNAAPISKHAPDDDHACTFNDVKKPSDAAKTVSLFTTPKRDKRKKKAKTVLAVLCAVAVYCINIMFALTAVEFMEPVMHGAMSNIITALFSSVITLTGIEVYGYISKTID